MTARRRSQWRATSAGPAPASSSRTASAREVADRSAPVRSAASTSRTTSWTNTTRPSGSRSRTPAASAVSSSLEHAALREVADRGEVARVDLAAGQARHRQQRQARRGQAARPRPHRVGQLRLPAQPRQQAGPRRGGDAGEQARDGADEQRVAPRPGQHRLGQRRRWRLVEHVRRAARGRRPRPAAPQPYGRDRRLGLQPRQLRGQRAAGSARRARARPGGGWPAPARARRASRGASARSSASEVASAQCRSSSTTSAPPTGRAASTSSASDCSAMKRSARASSPVPAAPSRAGARPCTPRPASTGAHGHSGGAASSASARPTSTAQPVLRRPARPRRAPGCSCRCPAGPVTSSSPPSPARAAVEPRAQVGELPGRPATRGAAPCAPAWTRTPGPRPARLPVGAAGRACVVPRMPRQRTGRSLLAHPLRRPAAPGGPRARHRPHPRQHSRPDRGGTGAPVLRRCLADPGGPTGPGGEPWPDEPTARATGDEVWSVVAHHLGRSVGLPPTTAQLVRFDGPRDAAAVAASRRAGDERIWPAVRDLDGLVDTRVLAQPGRRRAGPVLRDVRRALRPGGGADHVHGAAAGEDPALLPGPDRIEVLHVVPTPAVATPATVTA